MRHFIRILVAILGFSWVAGTAFAQEEPMLLVPDPQLLSIKTQDGVQNFTLEIADTNDARSRGLMHRTDFPDDRAMIFVFDAVQPVAMWMANTPLPLDMVFADATGKIVRIAEHTVPFSKAIVTSGEPVAFVVELNAGTSARLGIKAGDHLRHRIICGTCE